MQVEDFFARLWADFETFAPTAAAIRGALEASGEVVLNDHVAFRTFDLPPADRAGLIGALAPLGYVPYDEYHFPEKRLRATALRHARLAMPLIFLSEFETASLSAPCRRLVAGLMDQALGHWGAGGPPGAATFWSGTPWGPIRHDDYLALAAESEYAGWLAVNGFHANHFTIAVHALRRPELPPLLDWVRSRGYALNEEGGRIKGGPGVLLEQASTRADRRTVRFACGQSAEVPGGYCEFARRYPDPAGGGLFQGFVPASADRVFESTHRV